MAPFFEEDHLLLIPGPTPVTREVLNALAVPTISHTSEAFAGLFSRALQLLADLIDARDGKVFVMAGSGTLAQESAIINFVSPNDKLLVVENGFFSNRMYKIAQVHGLDVDHVSVEWGAAIEPSLLTENIDRTGASIVAITHVETSTGALTDLPEILGAAHDRGCAVMVDGVAAMGGVPEPMGQLDIDILLSGSQKALGVPPGLAIVAASEKTWSKRIKRTDTVRAFYQDLTNWSSVMNDPKKYFATPPVNLIRALACALEIVSREGVETRFARHVRVADQFRHRLLDLGFNLFTDSRYLSPTLSVFRVPLGHSSSEFRRRLYENGVVCAGGIGDTEDRVVRFGHMGNVTDVEISGAIEAISRSL